MATQTRGRKRLLEEVEEDTLDSIDGKKAKNEVFKPPLKFGGIYNPPPVDVWGEKGENEPEWPEPERLMWNIFLPARIYL